MPPNFFSAKIYLVLLTEKEFLVPLSQNSIFLNVSLYVESILGGISCFIKAETFAELQAAEQTIRFFWGSYEFFSDIGSLPHALQDLMLKKELTLCLAESCTGGYLSHLITKVSGSSEYFLGSFVTYSNFLKTKLLQVPEVLLNTFGAVSEPVVISMLEGALAFSLADIGIAVSGLAGPLGGSLEKPIGTVFAALGSKNSYVFGFFEIQGSREDVIVLASYKLLAMLYRKVAYGAISPGFTHALIPSQ